MAVISRKFEKGIKYTLVIFLDSLYHLGHGGAVHPKLDWVRIHALCHYGEDVRVRGQEGVHELKESGSALLNETGGILSPEEASFII